MNLSIEVDVNGEVRKYRFGEVTDITVGREDDNLISPIVDSISRHHARIFFKDSSWFVKDLDSTNGSFLNDKKLAQEERLSNGDKLRFGKISATVTFEVQAELKSLPPAANAPVVPEKFAPAKPVSAAPAAAPAKPAPAPAAAPAAAPAKPAPAVDDVPELPVDDVPELTPVAPEPPKPPVSPISPITPIKPVLKKPVLGGGLKAGLKLPPRPGAAGAGLKLPPKPAAGLKAGLKLPPKANNALKPGLKLPPKTGAADAAK